MQLPEYEKLTASGYSGSGYSGGSGAEWPIPEDPNVITRSKILEEGKVSEKRTYVFSRKKFDKNNQYKWFPIGWAVNINNLGEPDDVDTPYGEWKNGNINYLIDQGCWWFNFIYAINYSNTEAWGEIYTRPRSQWATTEKHIRLLNYLKNKKIETDGKIDIKALIPILDKKSDYSRFYLNGTWDGIPNNELEELENRVSRISEEEQLLGWMLIDEPYGGDLARALGTREKLYKDIIKYKRLLQRYDKNRSNHPIYNIIRGNGNYSFNSEEHPEYLRLLDQLRGIGDYILDDLYLCDFVNSDKYLALTVDRTKQAMENLIENKANIKSLYLRKAWGLLSQGSYIDGVINPVNGSSFLLEEELRYQNYASWINGAQGCCFWLLSKSDYYSFDNVKNVSYEAYKCSKFLMEEYDNNFDGIKCYSSNNDVQFLIRRNPQGKLLFMICNNSRENVDSHIAFPEELNVTKLVPITYNLKSYWYNEYVYHSEPGNEYFSLQLKPLTARAYYLY